MKQLIEKLQVKTEQLRLQLCQMEKQYLYGESPEQLEQALKVAALSEKITLLSRSLPVYTGHPLGVFSAAQVTAASVPIKIGFTRERWFSLCLPMLMPKKNGGSADYIRTLLYPAMQDFFAKKEPIRYRDAVLIYRHVYDRERPARQMRDHDNLEINIVSDIVAMYVMPDDGPAVCAHYYCSAAAERERTEVYVVPKAEFPLWLMREKEMPDAGEKLHGTPS